jgi:hypothetical protein
MCAPPRLCPVVLLVVISIYAAACGDDTPTAPTPQTPALSQLSLTPATVNAGASSEGLVILTGPAPANGAAVRISSSDGVAVVPASVMVPAGAASASFTIATRLVAADTTATISALLSADKRDAVLRVVAPIPRPPTLQALEIEPATVKGGQFTVATIRLTGAAVTTMYVTLRTSSMLVVLPSCVVSTTLVPSCVPVQGGTSTATFTITTRPVTLDTVFDIVATLGDEVRGGQIRLTP